MTGVQTGTIDMAYLGVANAAVLKGGGALNVVYVPYLFKNKQVVPEIVNSPLFQEFYDSLARESNVRVFASYGSRLARACNTVKGPIVKPADLKGMKIRVPPIEVMRATWEKLGTKPVIMGLGDIYMALSRGQIEGQENGMDAIIAYKWYEVTKHYSPLDQTYEVSAYYMNEKLWQQLDAGGEGHHDQGRQAGRRRYDQGRRGSPEAGHRDHEAARADHHRARPRRRSRKRSRTSTNPTRASSGRSGWWKRSRRCRSRRSVTSEE